MTHVIVIDIEGDRGAAVGRLRLDAELVGDVVLRGCKLNSQGRWPGRGLTEARCAKACRDAGVEIGVRRELIGGSNVPVEFLGAPRVVLRHGQSGQGARWHVEGPVIQRIAHPAAQLELGGEGVLERAEYRLGIVSLLRDGRVSDRQAVVDVVIADAGGVLVEEEEARSEERRVGKECRSGWSQYHLKTKQ